MPVTDRRYCVVGIYWADHPDEPEMLAVDGRMVVFDTADYARNVLPTFAPGRFTCWDRERETVWFTPLTKRGFNRLAIYTGYDPYDVPNGLRRTGVWSEAEWRDWRYHVHISNVIKGLHVWADQLAEEHTLEMAKAPGVMAGVV